MRHDLTWYALRTAPQREGDVQAWLTGFRPRISAPTRNRQTASGCALPTPITIPRTKPKLYRHGGGVAVLVPAFRVFRFANKTARRKKRITVPIMRGWVIAGFQSPNVNWLKVFESDLIIGAAGNGQGPSPVQKAHVQLFLSRCRKKAADLPEYYQHMPSRFEFDPGDEAELLKGPMAGLTMRVERIVEHQAQGWIPMAGQNVVVWSALENLAKVG
ncbi:MAG: hypothetical protein AAF813_09050 [Pseudomonadota bacterium]